MASQNPLTAFAGNLQNVSGKLDRVFKRHGTSVSEFIAFLAKPENEYAIEKIAEIFNPFRFTDVVEISTPALPRPALADLKAEYPFIRKIERDTSSTQAVTLRLAMVLRDGEKSVGGAEYERRIEDKHEILLGFQQAKWLVLHQDEHTAFRALLRKIYIDFSGLVAVDEYGHRRVPHLFQNDERWYLHWRWLFDDFNSHGRIAVSCK